jgi:hypothetical protein
MRAEELAALRQVQGKRRGREFVAHCPVHPDTRPSLNFRNGDTAVVIVCRSQGCAVADILRAWNLTLADITFAGKNGHARTGGRVVVTYEYIDALGRVAYRKHRTAPKGFWCDRPDGAGGWISGWKGIARHVYRRHTLIDEPEVFIAEGERDADRLALLGLIATTNDAGAGATHWDTLHTQQLVEAGVRRVWVLDLNPRAAWLVAEVPHLRIIDDAGWDAAKQRQAATRQVAQQGLVRARRPLYVFSGLTTCGGGFTLSSRSTLRCFNASSRGTCTNHRTITRQELEERVLRAIQERFFAPGVFDEFCRGYVEETNRLHHERRAAMANAPKEIASSTAGRRRFSSCC